MQLTLDQIGTLRNLFLRLLPTEPELRLFLHDRVGGRELDQVSLAPNLTLIVSEMIGEASKKGWLDELVDAFGKEFPQDTSLAAFIREATPASPRRAQAEPYDACFVESHPFVNRGPLRELLRSLHAPKPKALKKPRILIIRGNTKSGKSHTKYLINHLAAKYGFEKAFVDLASNGGDVSRPTVARTIGALMRLTGVPQPGTEQLTRWALNFFADFVGQIGDSAWWLVIDDFEHVSVSDELAEFIDELAGKINLSLPNVRLILIGYKREPLSTVSRIVVQETTEPISDEQLANFFAQFYREYGPALGDDELSDKIAEHVPEVRAKMDAKPEEHRYFEMESALTELCDRIASEA
jgi:hypothetical protein